MDAADRFVPVEHTCTYEERRFGTCNCRQNYLRANDNLRSQQRSPLPGNFVWPLRQEERTQLKAQLHQHLSALTSGRRILHLRTALGWTQQRAAMELGISRRTLIRHEQGLYGTQWTRNVLLMRLQQVEATHEEALIAYARGGRLQTQTL